MAYSITLPPEFRGTEKDKLMQVYRHLYKLSNELNTALNQVSQQAAREATQAVAAATGVSGTTIDKKIMDSYDAARSLIIKESETVYASMDEIRQDLESNYLAISEFGTFQENLTNTIETTAEGIVQNFDYSSILEPITNDMAGFSAYQAKTEQYIKIGIVGEDDYGIPVAGIVVGNNLSEVIIDGETHVVSQDMYSCFTADQLSFWKSGVRQAYISNETLYVTNISATNHIEIGTGADKWRIDTTNGFTIRNVG